MNQTTCCGKQCEATAGIKRMYKKLCAACSKRSDYFQQRTLIFLVLAALIGCPSLSQAAEPVKLLINTSHGLSNARGAVHDVGISLTSQVLVSASSNQNGRPYLPPDALLDLGLAHGATIISSSFSGWRYLYDSAGYAKLIDKKTTHVYAYEPRLDQPLSAPPPAAFVTVNRLGGKTGGGIEFGLPVNYMRGKGGDSSPSGVTAQLAGLMACLKYRHPNWNWFDVKAALRTTASNFATGYDPRNYGYGAIDYYAADALDDPERIPLFAPATVVDRRGNLIIFRINAFRQQRRFTETLFKFTSRPPLTKKEMTLQYITDLGGKFVSSSYLAQNNSTYAYHISPEETLYFVWFTHDLQGNYSRIESYGILGSFTGVSAATPGLRQLSTYAPMNIRLRHTTIKKGPE